MTFSGASNLCLLLCTKGFYKNIEPSVGDHLFSELKAWHFIQNERLNFISKIRGYSSFLVEEFAKFVFTNLKK